MVLKVPTKISHKGGLNSKQCLKDSVKLIASGRKSALPGMCCNDQRLITATRKKTFALYQTLVTLLLFLIDKVKSQGLSSYTYPSRGSHPKCGLDVTRSTWSTPSTLWILNIFDGTHILPPSIKISFDVPSDQNNGTTEVIFDPSIKSKHVAYVGFWVKLDPSMVLPAPLPVPSIYGSDQPFEKLGLKRISTQK